MPKATKAEEASLLIAIGMNCRDGRHSQSTAHLDRSSWMELIWVSHLSLRRSQPRTTRGREAKGCVYFVGQCAMLHPFAVFPLRFLVMFIAIGRAPHQTQGDRARIEDAGLIINQVVQTHRAQANSPNSWCTKGGDGVQGKAPGSHSCGALAFFVPPGPKKISERAGPKRTSQ